MRIVKKVTVSDWRRCGARSSQSFPGIAVTPSGRIIVSWRSAPKKEAVADQGILLSTSDDGGQSWSAPRSCFTAPELDGRPGCFRMGHASAVGNKLLMQLCWVDCSRPGLPFFNEENSGLLDCKIFLSESGDDGESWSAPVPLDTAPFAAQPTPTTGPALGFPDGEIVSQFELNKPYDSPEVWRHLPVLNFSRDGGRSFYRHAIPASDPGNNIFYWDQRPLILGDGKSIVDFFWTWDNANGVYHNISRVFSADRGVTWSAPADTGVSGQPGQPVEFADGSLLLPLVDRTAAPKIVVRLSHDQGCSFTPEALVLSDDDVSRQSEERNTLNSAWSEMTNFSRGLPAGCRTKDGTAGVVWYSGSSTDETDIEFAEVALE